MSDSTALVFRKLTSSSLAKSIFKAEVPENYIKSIPAQSLFLAIQTNGLSTSSDLIEIATIRQCRLIMDFDCWKKDRINEERFFDWLGLPDENNNLELLTKILKFVDYKVVAYFIAKYIHVVIHEEATDSPPGPGYYTPDRGITWIFIHGPNEQGIFLLGRFLAAIYEFSAEVFYQLISSQDITTLSDFEEEAYQEKNKRLAAEGIPEYEFARELNSPISLSNISTQLASAEGAVVSTDIAPIDPLIFDTKIVRPLGTLVENISDVSLFTTELTYIMNSALVFWQVDFSDRDNMSLLAEQVKGAINIGLQTIESQKSLDILEIYRAVGLRDLYRLGLSELFDLRKLALGLSKKHLTELDKTSLSYATLKSSSKPFPAMASISETETESVVTIRAIETLKDVNNIRSVLSDLEASANLKII